jgi:hypothetical protein
LGDQIIENTYTVATIIDIIPKLGGYSNILIVGALVFTSFNFPCSSCCLKMKASCSCCKTCPCCKKKKATEDKVSDEEDQESLSGKKKKPERSDEADKDKEAEAKQSKKFKCPCGGKAKSARPPV